MITRHYITSQDLSILKRDNVLLAEYLSTLETSQAKDSQIGPGVILS